jgi:hypothetical protein
VHRLNYTLASLLCSSLALAQTTQSPPQLSPQAAYEQATRPLEITRRSIENWSDSETAALAVAIKQAKDNCSARTPDQFTGENLIAFARLCALGQQWPSVKEAATLYVNVQHRTGPAEKSSFFPGLAQAYAYLIDSSLHLNDTETALASARDMLRSVPYNDLTSEATNETIRFLQLIHTSDALSLFAQRQTILLALLRSRSTPNPSSTTEPSIAIHTIYADAIAFAALQQLANQPDAAATTISELEAALPSNLSSDDAILTAEIRRQYALLGSPLPAIQPSAYLLHTPATTPPRINTSFGSATAFLLFPDWCAQCIRMGSQFMPALFRIGQNDVRFYALLTQTVLPSPSMSSAPTAKHAVVKDSKVARSTSPAAQTSPDPERPKTSAELLQGTPTLIVSNDIPSRFAVTDFPFLIVTDHQGIIRFLQPAPENTLVPGGLMDQVTARVIEQWPLPSAK